MSLKPIKIWSHWGALNPWKVIILFEELNVPYEIEILEFSDVKNPEYLEVNPNGRLPTIKDPNTGVLLWETCRKVPMPAVAGFQASGNIVLLSRKHMSHGRRAHLAFIGQGPYFGQATWFARFHQEKLPSATERYVNEILRVIGVLEEGLTRNSTGWLVGDRCTYADLSFITWASVGKGLLQEMGKADDLEVKYPKYTSWLRSMEEREKVAKCIALIAEGRAAHGLK